MKDAKSVTSISLFKNNVQAGTLLRKPFGCELVFDSEFVEKNRGSFLTYQIPIQAEPIEFRGGGIPPYFAGLLPEGLRLEAIVRRLKTSKDDMFSFLVEAGADPIGDIHFFKDEGRRAGKDLLPTDFANIGEGALPERGLDDFAGVQLKISGERITLPIGFRRRNKATILKLASKKFPGLVENEFYSLQLAKKCGLEVNGAKIIHDQQGVSGLLVDRFDKIFDAKTKLWERYHVEDACQFLDYYPADKYNLSMQEIADGIAKFSSAPEIEILNLLKQVAFSYLLGNGDLHAKNVSLIQRGPHHPRTLSPAYDLVCTALYGDVQMALSMDGKKDNLKYANFIEFGKRYGVSEVAVASMLGRLAKDFQKHAKMMFQFPAAAEKENFLNQFFAKRIEHLSEDRT